MRSVLALGVGLILSGGLQAQPCGGPCGPSGPSGPCDAGGVNPGAAPLVGPDGGNEGGSEGPAPRFRDSKDVVEYIREHYGNDTRAGQNDPRVKDWLSQAGGEDRYIFQDRLTNSHDFSGDPTIDRISGTATNDYYCHDFAWRGGDKTPPPGGHLNPDPILSNPELYGYTRVTDGRPQSGDIVVYHNDGAGASHSGLVVRVQDGNVYMISKDVGNSLFRHQLDSPNGQPNFFRDAYGGNGVTIIRPGPYAVRPTANGAPPPAAQGP